MKTGKVGYMRVAATSLMARSIHKSMKTRGFDGSVSFVRIPRNNYTLVVGGNIYDNERDYDDRTGTFKTIKVEYPSDYYACPRYLTSKDLRAIMAGATEKTYDGFMNEVYREIEI